MPEKIDEISRICSPNQTVNYEKRTVVISLIWKYMERCGCQGVQFVLSIILARLVSPSDYGIIALILIFIQIATVFVQSGFNTALIQKKNADEIDFSSVLYLSLFVALILYTVLFFAAPLIAAFYKIDQLKLLVRVLSVTLFFGALNSVQCAFVSKNMQFRGLFFSSTGAVLGSGIVGVVLAYKGFGVWSLVFQQLLNNALNCLILWFTVKWRPKLYFSFKRVKQLFSFGWKLLCSGLLDTIFRNAYGLVIGRVYDSSQLGLFNRGQQFPQVIASNLDGSIQSVMLPTLSAHNDNVLKVKQLARRSISTSSYLLMPCMLGLVAIAEPLVKLLLTDKWLGCVPFLQLACISYSLFPIHTANLTAINAMGRSDVFLKLEIVKKVLTAVTLLVTIPYGIMAMAIGQVISGIISTFINSYPNKRLLNYPYIEQIKDIGASGALAAFMAVSIWPLGKLQLPTFGVLCIQISACIFIYIIGSAIVRIEPYTYLLNSMRNAKKRHTYE